MRRWMVAAVLSVSSVAAAKPAAIFIPPMEAEVGAGSPVDGSEVGVSTEFRIGAHWASLYWKPTRWDVGFGFVTSTRSTLTGTVERSIAPEQQGLTLNGAYISAAYAIENHKHWRTWLGGRFEMLGGSRDGRDVATTGFAVRLATELYSAGLGGASDHSAAALFAGAFAVGVYVEGIQRGLPGDFGELDAGAGLTMRIPFLAAVAN
jgi:hypothetical protein